METFECVIYFGKCERLYGQKPFTKVHEITDCSDLDENIRCNADGVEMCQDILPDYEGAMQKIANARELYNSRCGQNTAEVEERGTSETASECQAMSQECVAMVGRFQYSSDLSVLCGDLREMVGCMENLIEHCSSILPNIFTLRSQLARSQSQVGRLCAMQLPGGTLPTPTGKQAECTSLLQSCLSHFSSINYNDGLESTCSKLRTIVGCLRNVIDECRTVLPNAAQVERNMMTAQQQVSNTCGSVSERGTRETASECQAMSQECVAMVGRFQYSSDLSVLCGDLREMVGCMENVVGRCSSILPNIITLRSQLARSQSQVGKLCAMQLPGGTLPTPTGKQAECTSLLQSCLRHFSSINYDDGLESTCSNLRTIVGCFKNVLKKCRTVLPNAAQIERNMMTAQQQVSNTCGSVSGSGSNMVTSSPSSGGATLSECSTMTSKCMSSLTSLMGDQNPESICRILTSTVECFDEVIDKCSNVLPNIGEIETQMVAARQQVGQACTRPSPNAGPPDVSQGTKAGPPGISQECNQMAQECLKMLPNLSVSPDKEQTCRGFQKIKSCLETAVENCGADQAQAQGQMTGLEQQIAQICGSMNFEPETAVESKPVEGGMQNMNCHRDLQRCSTEFDIESQSDADCDDMLAAFECYRNVTDACPGVFPLKVIFMVDTLEEKVKQCNFTTEETEEVDDAWCASQAQTCLDMISSFSVKNGMEATCSSLQSMVKCFDDVMDKCQSAIADLQKNYGQLMAMKEKISSGCRKGGTGLVITPNSNQEKCMNKYKRCAGLMAKVPLHEDNTVMCPKLRRSMACIKKVTLECGNLLPESTKQQFSNFENLNKICPVGSYKAGKRGKFTEKCKKDIKVCDNKVSEIMNGGDDIEQKDCRVGFRTLTCYRQVARECRLPKSNRKFFKQFKSLLTDTCERRSTVKHTRGLIDFDIDWPDLELDGDWEEDDSSEDGVLFGYD